ncbi:hypothetical protein ACS0TY_031042 [Phlomoides rotata]
MWAIRRASIHLKNRGLCSGSTRICCVKSEITGYYLENNNAGIIDSQGKMLDALVCSRKYHKKSSFSKPYMEICTFSSHAGAKLSVGQDASLDKVDYELTFGSGLSEDELEGSDTETDVGKKDSFRTAGTSAMTKAILADPVALVSKVLDKWVQKGNEVTADEASKTMFYLRKRRMYFKALQLSEWLDSTGNLELTERNYASRVDLIAKTRGMFKAEEYIKQIPESFRGELIYRCLLAHSVFARDEKKSEEYFNKMKNMFPLSCFACDQMLLMYKRTDRKKIGDVLSLMDKQNIKASIFTYQILIDVKGQTGDITGMEQVLETMKCNGLEPSSYIQASLSRHYATVGLKDKAEAVLKELEGDDLKTKRWVCRYLLPIYASLGREDEVERIWKVCESDPRLSECLSAIEAWGKLKRIEDAEAIFDRMLKIVKRPSPKHYTPLLNIYTNHNMLAKGKDLVAQMAETGSIDFPVVWDALVRLHVKAGEVEKAEYILKMAVQRRRGRPIATSYLTILDHYAKIGDVRNSEEVFLEMRRVGFPARSRSYRSLLYAYVNAETPAYGFAERLRGDNVVPTKEIGLLLAQLDSFRKPTVPEVAELLKM